MSVYGLMELLTAWLYWRHRRPVSCPSVDEAELPAVTVNPFLMNALRWNGSTNGPISSITPDRLQIPGGR
ncbi:MAG: hypothetical protein H6668_04420 [Ardenticatenaceae bacterium]|nr:hypothetical protein [Ardenticatenaceae bacterium]